MALIEEQLQALLERIAVLEQKTQGISYSPPKYQDLSVPHKGGDCNIQPGKGDLGAADGDIYLRNAQETDAAVFDWETLTFIRV